MTREEAIQELKEINTALESWSGFTKYPHALYIAIDMAIEALQTDLVRCKDCRHWLQHEQFGFDEDNDEYHDYCALLVPDDDYYAYTRKADDFCSRGERREP